MSIGALRRGILGFMLAVERVVADWVVSPGPAVHIERVSTLFTGRGAMLAEGVRLLL